jgi:glycosyltransferase involved in cell wall biosynthesis
MSQDKPLVSILTPSFNQGRFLQDCIDSVANQTYRPIEHIIMDGGSTEETLDILRKAPAHVRWVSEPDRGQSHAVNKAFAMSTGSIIGWVNSDDGYLVRDAIERAVEAFEQSPEVGVVFGDAVMIDEHNRVLRHHRAYLPTSTRLPPFSFTIAQPAAFIRKSSLRLSGENLLREHLLVMLDSELWLRLRKAGVGFRHLGSPLAIDRNHTTRKVRNLEALALEEEAELAREYGFIVRRNLADRLRSLGRRPAGLRAIWSRELRDRLAIRCVFNPRLSYLVGQLFVPHARHFTAGER